MDRAIILSYVYQHFSIYYDISIIELNNLNLNFPDTGRHFFTTTEAHPKNIHWKKNDELDLPLLFEKENEKDWYTLNEQSITFHYDLPSMIFYFMSGWQEEYCIKFDQYNRFPYSESIQKELNIVLTPVVNHYFDILQKGISSLLKRDLVLQEKFKINITHDIDVLNSGWRAPIINELKAFNLLRASKLFFNKLVKGATANQNIEEIIKFEQALDLASTFYFIPTNDTQKGIKNADYTLDEPYVKNMLSLIKKTTGFKLGLHTPSASNLTEETINQFNNQLGGNITTNRFHYLACQQKDLAIFENTSITEDSSLGFAEHIGFRHSIAWPFHPFNFETQSAMRVKEVPLVIMDVSLMNEQYMNLSIEEAKQKIDKLIIVLKNSNGIATVLLHNNNTYFYPFLNNFKNKISK